MNFISVMSLLAWKKDQAFRSPSVVKFRTAARRESDSFANTGTPKSGGSRQSFLVRRGFLSFFAFRDKALLELSKGG